MPTLHLTLQIQVVLGKSLVGLSLCVVALWPSQLSPSLWQHVFLHYPSVKGVSVGAWGDEIPGKAGGRSAGGKAPARLCSLILCAGKGCGHHDWCLGVGSPYPSSPQDMDPPALTAWRLQHSLSSSCCALPAGL